MVNYDLLKKHNYKSVINLPKTDITELNTFTKIMAWDLQKIVGVKYICRVHCRGESTGEDLKYLERFCTFQKS